MKTTTETETLQQHPQANAERAPRQVARKRREKNEKRNGRGAAHWRRPPPVLFGCRRKASRSHCRHRSELDATLNCPNLFKPPHCGRIAHGTQPLSQNGYGYISQKLTKSKHINDPDWVSGGKHSQKKWFPMRSICKRRAGKLYTARSRLYRSRLLQPYIFVGRNP